MKRMVLLVLGFFVSTSAFAQIATPPAKIACAPLAKIEASIVKNMAPDKVEFTKVTPGQYNFLQGLYAGSPETPPGLPPGETAILAMAEKQSNAVILFVRAGRFVCYPMGVAKELIKLMDEVITGKTDSAGDAM